MSRSLALFALLAVAGASASAEADSRAAGPDHIIHYRHKAMGTIIDLTIWGDDEARAANAAQKVFAEFDRVDRLMSSWSDDSDVARINAAAGASAVQIDGEVFAVVRRALRASRATRGAFDITVGAFRGLWKFDQDRDGTVPSLEEVRARLPLVGYRNVIVRSKARTVKLKKKGMRITLGGVAKGHAVDRAVAMLHDAGFVDFILQAGGDLYVSGRRGARSWRVGIRDPRGRRDATFAIAEIQNRTFSTSGDYERSVVVDGVRYHHILDPETGLPAGACRSVTVMAPDAVTADIWSTALFVLGSDRGMKMVEKKDELEAVFVDSKNQIHVSSGLRSKLRVIKKPTDGP